VGAFAHTSRHEWLTYQAHNSAKQMCGHCVVVAAGGVTPLISIGHILL